MPHTAAPRPTTPSPATPAAVSLPQMDDALIGDALSATELSAWLLASAGLPLLCIPSPPAREHLACMAVPIGLGLGADLDLGRSLASIAPNAMLLRRLTEAADALFADLRTRWPPYAAPPLIGLVTDGTGLGLSPDDPWPLAPGWIQRQRRGAASLVEIVPFAPVGAWRRQVMNG